MNVAIIEDVNLAANQLEKIITQLRPDYTVVVKLTSIEESIIWLRANIPDLIFLDIQLEDGISFKIFDEIKMDIPIIFTTAYDKYAIKAFELHSIDYLLKPLQLDSLKTSIEKFERLKGKQSLNIEKLMRAFSKSKPEYTQRITVKYGNKIKAINIKDIAWIKAKGNDVHIWLCNEREYTTDYALDYFERNLNPKDFFRISRQYIVNYKAIKEMEMFSKSKLLLKLIPKTEEQTFVSLSKYADFKVWLNK